MNRARLPVAVLCIGLVVFAGLIPMACAGFSVTLTPVWSLFQPEPGALVTPPLSLGTEQPLALTALSGSRAPPSLA
ncbi:MAG: hypothetical protein AB7P99_16780 [Vicinamibacterales bacterium]